MGIRVFLLLALLAASQICAQSLRDSIESAIGRGRSFLFSIQREDGAIADTVNPLFETWETIAALHALADAGSDTATPGFRLAMAWLRSQRNDLGMVCHNRRCQGKYCVETTSEYVQLLLLLGRSAGLKRLVDTVAAWQRPEGNWLIGNPDVRERQDFPSVTAFAVRILQMKGARYPGTETGVHWLVQHLHRDSLWGAAWEYYGSQWYAAWPAAEVLAILGNSYARSGLKWIARKLRDERLTEISGPGISMELENALKLSAWLPILKKPANWRMVPAPFWTLVRALLKCQRPDGSWDGGNFPAPSTRYTKKEYVFCTARIISVFSRILELSE